MKHIFSVLIIAAFLFCTSNALSEIEWRQLNGPYGGYVNNIVKKSATEIIALTSAASYMTTNQGLSWTALDFKTFTPIAFTFDNNATYCIASGSQGFNSLFVSKDNMVTWTEINIGLEKKRLQKIIVRSGQLYACSDSGVYKSENGGTSWTKTFTIQSLQYNYIYDMVFNSKGTIFLATVAGLYRSKDQGSTWVLMNPSSEIMKSNIENIIIDSEDKMFVNAPQGLFRSNDGGDSWTQVGEGIINTNIAALLNPQKSVIIAAKRWGGMFISRDDGDTWKKANDKDVQDLIISDDGKYFAASNNGVLYSDSLGGEWLPRNQGIMEAMVSAVYVIKSNDSHKDEILAGLSSGEIQKSSDAGQSWTHVFQSQGSQISSFVTGSNNTLLASSIWGGVMASTNNGDSWVNVQTGLDDPDIRELAIDSDGNLYACAFSVVYKSTNNGGEWTVCFASNQSIDGSGIAVNSKKMIFAGTKVYGVLRSTNGGTNWTQMINNFTYPIYYLTINKKDEVFAVTDAGDLYKSTSNGATWELLCAGIGIMKMFFLSDNNIIASVDQNHTVVGIMRSTDNGRTWSPETKGMGSRYVYCFDYNSKGELIAGTGSSIFKTLQSVVDVEESKSETENSLVFPNPAANFVSIKSTAQITVEIWSSYGVKLLTANNPDKINVSGLAPGVYFIKADNKMYHFIKD